MEDCQQFCVELLELICPDDKTLKNIRTYVYSNSFAYKLAISLNTPAPR